MKKITLFLLFNLLTISAIAQSPSLKFNGTDNAIDWADASPVLRTSGDHTWEMWIKGSSATVGVLYTEGWSGSAFRGQFRMNANGAGKLEIEFRNYAGTYLIANNTVSTTTVFDGTWHHIAVVGTTTAGMTTTVLFVDGVQDATDFGTYTRPTLWDTTDGGALNHSTIGQITRSSQWIVDTNYTWYDGEIDEFRAWTRALDITEISANKCVPLNNTNLFRYVKFNEGTGTTFADQMGGNSGILVGTTNTGTYTTNSGCTTLSTKDNVLNNNITIYPNPVSNILNISKFNTGITIKKVSLINVNGETVYTNGTAKSIDVSAFSKGLYVLKIESKEGGVLSKKIVLN